MFLFRLIYSTVMSFVIFGALLFVPAGTLDWQHGKILLGVMVVLNVLTLLALRKHKELLNERFKPIIQKGQPLVDKIILLIFVFSYLGWIIFIPLDVFHLHLLGQPGEAVSACGMFLFLAGWWVVYRALKENAFAAPVVKHQKERGQSVVDTGIYSIVRHPMYAGCVPLLIGMALWLQSYAAVSLVLIPIGVLAVRIVMEERFLCGHLEGYKAYRKRVHYRMIPFLW